ncbi:hypothetical protein DFH05DRAFT_1176046 [Lentinula detonsa]|uniref:Secreted protein n=1 Tax=Lentinula detonsa TaxID=2804962 RepID=A0A9W8P0E7_9AGAR|nr:hypothetical protein DFH05DRAFT_1176046 [Lentinula detonsa]
MGLWVLHILFPSPNLLLLIAPPVGTQELASTVFWQRVILSAPCHILMTPSLTLLVGDHRHHNCSSGPYVCFCTCDT